MPIRHVEPSAGLYLDICYLLANFQKISFNVISKVSVKGMDDDDDDDGGTAMKTMIISMITMIMVKRRKKYHDSCVPVSIAC